MAKIIHERDKCIGCGACVAVCPDYWEMNSDGRATLKGASLNEGGCGEIEVEEVGCNRGAAEICPTECIIIKKDEDKV